MTRRMLIALAAKPRWIVYDLQELISTWHKRNSPIDNTAETRHQFFTLCYNWLEEIRNAGKIAGHRVWCNQNNNTDDVVQRGDFIAQINIKSAQTLNIVEVHVLITDNGKQLKFKTI